MSAAVIAEHPELSPAITLPGVPAGHVRVGWSGFALALPQDWNLSHHAPAKTMTRQAMLVFSDLRGPALEVRWKRPRQFKLLPVSPAHALQAAARRLRHRQSVQELSGQELSGVHLLPQRGLALVAGGRHLYELHCPRHPERLDEITRDFAACLNLMQHGPWLWSVYGIHAWLPARARLRAISFRPGECRLRFRIPPQSKASTELPQGGVVTLASFSLAQQILRGRSLRAWASAELTPLRLLGDGTRGTWEESPHHASWRLTCRSFGIHTTHDLRLRHDPLANRLHWTHLVQRCMNRIPLPR